MGANEVIFNDGQIKAINAAHTEPIVVTAAAGSGKTLILVERVIRLLSDRTLNIPADSLAIMTFTRNATQSLQKKLNNALAEKLACPDMSEEDKNYLSDQLFRLRQANISTIDAFCLKVIKENPEAFGLPVTFSIADSAKLAAMQSQAINIAMQAFYNKTDNSENGFTDEERTALFYTFNFENDRALQEQVIDFADELSTYADAEKWISEALEIYKDEQSLEKQYIDVFKPTIEPLISQAVTLLPQYDEILSDIESEAKSLLDNPKKDKSALALADEVLPVMKNYAQLDKERFLNAEKYYKVFCDNPSIRTLGEFFTQVRSFSEMPKISTKGSRVPSRPLFTDLKNKLQNIAQTLAKNSFNTSGFNPKRQQTVIRSFVKLVRIYSDSLMFIKISNGYIGFSDAELMLLKKLRNDAEFCSEISSRYSCVIVDEFQDSNDIQAEIFKKLTGTNLFYVGDIKQSIYAFRGGNPDIMAQLCDGKDGFKPLELNYNYRSRNTIIEFVNAAFCGLMTREYGGVDYDTEENKLRFGAEYYPEIPSENKPLYSADFYLLDGKPDDEDKEYYQARFVARKIKELHDNENFKITRNGELVRPSYSDFLILLRNRQPIAAYRKALSELNISSSAPKGRSFLQSEEVGIVLNYLTIIDNPLKDEEMIKVLMSPVYRFTANEVAQIRLGLAGIEENTLSQEQKRVLAKRMKKYSLYNCLKICTQSLNTGDFFENETAVIGRISTEKISRFMNDLSSFRLLMSSNSLYKLICRIYEDTDAEAIAAAFEDSAQRVANIRHLRNMAADFEKNNGGSPSDFLRFIERVKSNQSQKVEDATRPQDSNTAVQIMTFHASKGLEAPVCILSELDTQLSTMDYSGTFLSNRSHYFAIMDVDVKRRVKSKTFPYCALERLNRKRACGEELRLLYVALTRAKEKLIMVSKGKLQDWSENILDPDNPQNVFDSSMPFRWITSSIMRYAAADAEGMRLNGVNCRIIQESYDGKPPVLKKPENTEQNFDITDKEIELLKKAINFHYPHEEDTKRQEKYSVTELAHRNSTMPISLKAPDFDNNKKAVGADKGNAYHNCMQYISFEKFKAALIEEYPEIVKSEIEKLQLVKKLTAVEAEAIEPEKISGFFEGELGQRMLHSDEIHREAPFFAEVTGAEIGEDDIKTIMLQGRIDLYFVENGEIVVVDYKSDNINNLEKEKDNYAKQVKIYGTVLPRLTGMTVKENYLYPFMLGKALKI